MGSPAGHPCSCPADSIAVKCNGDQEGSYRAGIFPVRLAIPCIKHTEPLRIGGQEGLLYDFSMLVISGHLDQRADCVFRVFLVFFPKYAHTSSPTPIPLTHLGPQKGRADPKQGPNPHSILKPTSRKRPFGPRYNSTNMPQFCSRSSDALGKLGSSIAEAIRTFKKATKRSFYPSLPLRVNRDLQPDQSVSLMGRIGRLWTATYDGEPKSHH